MPKQGFLLADVPKLFSTANDKPGWALCIGAGTSVPLFPDWYSLGSEMAKQLVPETPFDVEALKKSGFSPDSMIQMVKNATDLNDLEFTMRMSNILYHKFHVCPNCGYIFDEEIFSLVRSNYGTLNEDYICQQIRLLISATSDKLDLEKKQYVTLRQQMTEEETAFQSEKNEFDIYVRQRGLADSIRRFQQQLSKTISDIQEDEKNIKEISKELRKLPNKKEVEEKYIEYARLNIMTLDAWDPAYDGAIHLLKPIKAQGTLENKIILAQFVALFQTMEYFKTSATRFSFVVDSPRAKEASISSSKDILKMISQMEMLPQIILATIDYSEYDSEIETPANIIVLTEKRKLLNESDYVKNQDTIMAISELLKKQV